MFHVLSVFIADRAANLTSLDARSQLSAREFEISTGKARNDARCGEANIRAIIAIANTINQLRDLLLTETGVSAGVARFRARIAGGDAFNYLRVIR
jgi:hypothetical protein